MVCNASSIRFGSPSDDQRRIRSQSIARLSRNRSYHNQQDDDNESNVLLIRAELSDFWKCCLSSPRWQEHVQIVGHYLLYPNPYPKKSRLKNRFYAHPAFPLLMMTLMMGDGDHDINTNEELLVVRSNWENYLEEFKLAVNVWCKVGGSFSDWNAQSREDEWHPSASTSAAKWEVSGPTRLGSVLPPLTNFEAKYIQCGEPIYELSIRKTIQGTPRKNT